MGKVMFLVCLNLGGIPWNTPILVRMGVTLGYTLVLGWGTPVLGWGIPPG